MLSGAFAAVGAMAYSLIANGFGYYTPQVLLMTLVTQVISGMLLGGCLAKVVVDALSKTGVLNQYAIMKENEVRVTSMDSFLACSNLTVRFYEQPNPFFIKYLFLFKRGKGADIRTKWKREIYADFCACWHYSRAYGS